MCAQEECTKTAESYVCSKKSPSSLRCSIAVVPLVHSHRCWKELVQLTRPSESLFLAIDGVAPRAKMAQQRGRRYVRAKERKEESEVELAVRRECANELGAALEEIPCVLSTWDSNAITPGDQIHQYPHGTIPMLRDCHFPPTFFGTTVAEPLWGSATRTCDRFSTESPVLAGTGFMRRLSIHLAAFIRQQMNSDVWSDMEARTPHV